MSFSFAPDLEAVGIQFGSWIRGGWELNEPPGQSEFPLWSFGDLLTDLSPFLSPSFPPSLLSLSPSFSFPAHTLHKVSESEGRLAGKGQNKLRERSSICKTLIPCLTFTSLPVAPCTVLALCCTPGPEYAMLPREEEHSDPTACPIQVVPKLRSWTESGQGKRRSIWGGEQDRDRVYFWRPRHSSH